MYLYSLRNIKSPSVTRNKRTDEATFQPISIPMVVELVFYANYVKFISREFFSTRAPFLTIAVPTMI